MADPVSWYLIEKGWAVVGPDGKLGHVFEVLGDTRIDIFDGVVLESRLFRKHTIPAEQVTGITMGFVEVAIRTSEVDRLAPYSR